MPVEDDGAVSLRDITMDDCERIFQWQQLPSVRRFARHPVPPSWTEHCAWLSAKLAELDAVLQMIVHNGDDAGVVRLDRMASQGGEQYEVSIYVDPDHQGQGLATTALNLVRRRNPDVVLMAAIRPENRASLSLFQRAGYRPCGDGWYRSDALGSSAR